MANSWPPPVRIPMPHAVTCVSPYDKHVGFETALISGILLWEQAVRGVVMVLKEGWGLFYESLIKNSKPFSVKE